MNRRTKWMRRAAALAAGATLLQAQGCLVDTNVLTADVAQAVLTVLLDTLVGALSQAA